MFCRIARMQPLSRIFDKFYWNIPSSAIKGGIYFKTGLERMYKVPNDVPYSLLILLAACL
jgi:hypothetical protein